LSSRKRVQQRKFSIRNVFLTILEIVFFIIMIYSGRKIYIWWCENNKNTEILKTISKDIRIINENIEYEDPNNYEIDFASLKEKNSQTIGYLKLNGIDIEYPVVKASTNEYYLYHSFDKSDNGAGWIFADFRNSLDGNDKNIIIYGHNRRDGSMFGTLKKALTEEWYSNEKNRKIVFITESEKMIYEVFSVYKISVEDYYITTDFINDDEYTNFLSTIESRSTYNFGVELNSEDKIITLSTCDNNNQYRVVVHARKMKTE